MIFYYILVLTRTRLKALSGVLETVPHLVLLFGLLLVSVQCLSTSFDSLFYFREERREQVLDHSWSLDHEIKLSECGMSALECVC